ncbi:hypothetical protein [Flammeovirga kamogawensis]|uniref:Uncharacterized protein n=1 Tax=Flammeovirga kamogawensis TaxID=373891 RepID=A0ABX8GWN8_9BACT|nr:hypothetical protein [Flammeovirga kamogawensis]MBB6459580.1 hypothetical protein [Flammeovirga kamogawensis]QWG07355.1 hypothetical protein KM029_18935 [Flammeovirga kamogawensis]TRX69172.1 hypothetical protein EO216_13935 [Flammeovirga kamogawensis]
MRRNFTAAGSDLESLLNDTEKQCLYFKKAASSQTLEVAILTPSGMTALGALEVAKLMEVVTKHFADAEMEFEFGECQGSEYCVEVAW